MTESELKLAALERYIAQLEAQNAEMLAALKCLETNAAEDMPEYAATKHFWDALDAARAAIAKATLVAGYNVLRIRIPKGVQRFIRLTYTVGVAVLTAGQFDANLVMDVQTND